MKYMMKCPMCETIVTVEAEDEMDGMMKMKEDAKAHVVDMHKDAPPMSEEDMEKMIRESWKMEM